MDIPYSAKFSRVFNFVKFQPFAKLSQRKFVTCNVDGQHAAKSTSDALQRGTAFLIAVSLSVDNGVAMCIR